MTLLTILFLLLPAGHSVQANASDLCPQWLISNLSSPTAQPLDEALVPKQMNERGISFMPVTLDDDNRALQITPGDETALNKLASTLSDNYDADVVVPLSMVRGSAQLGNATLWKPANSDHLKPLLILKAGSWIPLVELPMRDIAVLHKINQVKTLDYLLRRAPFGLYGQIRQVRTAGPEAVAADDVIQSVNFDEIKAFHTQLKEEVLIVKGGLVRGHSMATDRLHELLSDAVQFSEIVDRSVVAHQLLENAYRNSPASIQFVKSDQGITEARLTVNEDIVALPLVDVNSPVSPNIWSAFERQTAWLKTVVTEARHQAGDINALLKDLIKSADETRMDRNLELRYLANIQSVLNPTKLRVYTPPSESEIVRLFGKR